MKFGNQCVLMKKKMWYPYTVQYYSAIRKDEIRPFATTWMDLEEIMLSDMSDRKS